MKYIANPVEVEAWRIEAIQMLSDGAGCNCLLDDKRLVTAHAGMLARYHPIIGDYWVRQEDGYVYINPKEVFERKYRKAE